MGDARLSGDSAQARGECAATFPSGEHACVRHRERRWRSRGSALRIRASGHTLAPSSVVPALSPTMQTDQSSFLRVPAVCRVGEASD